MTLEHYFATGHVTADAKLQIRNRRAFDQAMQAMREKEVVIEIRRARATRSAAQNAWYWSCLVQLVAEHTGYSPEEIHEIYKAKFLPKSLSVADGNGEIKEEFVIGGTTTTLNKLEFGEYCERIRQWAAEELGVVIPDPTSHGDPVTRQKGQAA